jgi:hypothetical protein
MPRAVIHIGANKTGSTTLQRCLFARTEDLVYLGEDCAGYENYRDALNSLVSDDDIHFDYEATKRVFGKFMLSCGKRTFLYSNEDIMTSRVPTKCAQRLHDLLPDAMVLVIVRNQLTAIPSFYANHGAYLKMVPRRYWRRYVSFDEWMEYCTGFMKYSPLDSYFYHRILNLYASLFGKQKMCILFYEDFVNDQEKFFNDLCSILRTQKDEALKLLRGKRERRRITKREFRYHQVRSLVLRDVSFRHRLPFEAALRRMWWNFLEGGAPADGFMSDYWRNKIVELYKEDNTKLATEYCLPLKEYGYPVA